MIPADTDLITARLRGKTLVGCVTLTNDRAAIVFDDSTILAIDAFGRTWILSDEESADALATVARTLTRQGAELDTLHALAAGNDPGARLTARREATVRDRDRSSTRVPVRTIDDLDVPDFMRGPVLADEGVAPRSDVERKARTEQLNRELPEV